MSELFARGRNTALQDLAVLMKSGSDKGSHLVSEEQHMEK